MDTIKVKETQPKKQIDIEYIVYNPQPLLHKPKYLHNF